MTKRFHADVLYNITLLKETKDSKTIHLIPEFFHQILRTIIVGTILVHSQLDNRGMNQNCRKILMYINVPDSLSIVTKLGKF